MTKKYKKFLGVTLATVTILLIAGLAIHATNTINSLNSEVNSLKQEVQVKNKEINSLKSTINEKKEVIEEQQNKIKENNNLIIEKDKIIEQKDAKIKQLSSVQSSVHFNSSDVTQKSGANAATMQKMLNGTNMENYAWAFVEAEKKYGVNAVFLAAIVAEESGWGKSRRAIEDNNLAGLGVPKATSRGMTFRSESESIFYLASLLKNNYLTESGKYFNGKSVAGVNVKYCVGNQWTSNVIGTANIMLGKL